MWYENPDLAIDSFVTKERGNVCIVLGGGLITKRRVSSVHLEELVEGGDTELEAVNQSN
jgi:hypothetical protein